MSVEEKLTLLVVKYIRPFLNEAGFTPSRGNVFTREEGDACWTVAVRLTKDRDLEYGQVLPTVCVGFRSLAKFLKRCPLELVNAMRTPCFMGSDLGHLHPPFQYRHWIIDSKTDIENVGPEIVAVIGRYGLKFFQDFGELRNAVKAWESGTYYDLGLDRFFFLAAAYWLDGQPERALKLIREQIANFDREWNLKHQNEDRVYSERFRVFLGFLEAESPRQMDPGGR